VNEEKRDIFTTWTDSYTAVSKMWEDSYLKLYKPWIEPTGEMFEKAVELSKEAAPQKYKEFYDEWVKVYLNAYGKFYPVPTLESNKKTLEKLMASAEESNKLYSSWIAELEGNSQKTMKILQGEPDPSKYKKCYDMWIKSYEKIFDELLTLPAQENIKEIFEKYTGIPDIYLGSFVQISKLWRDSYARQYEPWIESISKLSIKMAELSRGDASPEAYKEFYTMWMDSYKESYGKYVRFTPLSKEILDNFSQSTNIYLNLYKSWIAAIEKLSEKINELSKQTADPEEYQEFYDLMAKMYEKAFDTFFEDIPLQGPMKEMMEPAKIMARMYADTFSRMSKMQVK